MSITNAERHDLQKGLEELLGEQRANVLMEHLPPVGWADVATKRDLDNLEERLRGESRYEFGELRHEIGTVRTDLQNEMGTLRYDLQLQIADLRGTLTGQQLRHTVALVGILGTLMAIINAIG